ncbi:MAG: acetyl-CoA decarbonylase/synthase complex subunit gamma [Methanoregulaceae archaeon]|nr:acetyl-CoA decarbonylase/synthase complex subunit gamma [Methanoregulaceae archaeon]
MRKNIREISPIDVYKLLPRTNCKECGESNCMAFATKLVNSEKNIEDCSPLFWSENAALYAQLKELLAPPITAVMFGTGENAVKIGGKHVVYRHELTYHNPPPIFIDIDDLTKEEELEQKVRAVNTFSYNYIGRNLILNGLALRCTSGDPAVFAATAEKVANLTSLPLILCSFDLRVMEAGLVKVNNRRPLIYAATQENWMGMADLALKYQCPLVVAVPQDIGLLRSIVKTLKAFGLTDLVLDPGTAYDHGLARTIYTFSSIRWAGCRGEDELLGYPLLASPISVWTESEISREIMAWNEACLAAMLISRYADLLIMHSLEGWVLLPQLIWRFNLYTDPRKPVSVEPGLRTFGTPHRDSPVLLTSNYALTYFTVESDLKSANVDCYLIVVDTAGISVESAVAGRYLTAEKVASALKDSGVGEMVNHTFLILPGLAARISGESEETTSWHILVGPRDSSGLPKYLKEHWPPKGEE